MLKLKSENFLLGSCYWGKCIKLPNKVLLDKAFLGQIKQPLRNRSYFRDHPYHLLETKLKCVNCALWVASEESLWMGFYSAACTAGVEC